MAVSALILGTLMALTLIAAPGTELWRLRVRATTAGRALPGIPQAPQSAPPE
jgi:hypothetical protein